MTDNMNEQLPPNHSQHYKGKKGKTYFAAHFDGRLTLGRQIQAELFLPYCNNHFSLLDFGCGDGTILRTLPASKKVGVELNPSCHAKIEDLNKDEEVPIEAYYSLDQVDATGFDLVISNHCLEHVPNPLQILCKINALLCDGGHFICIIPFDDWRCKKNRCWRPNDGDQHIYTWSPMNLGNLLGLAEFQVKSVRLRTFAWSPKIYWIKSLFNETVFNSAAVILSFVKNRREIISVSQRIADHV